MSKRRKSIKVRRADPKHGNARGRIKSRQVISRMDTGPFALRVGLLMYVPTLKQYRAIERSYVIECSNRAELEYVRQELDKVLGGMNGVIVTPKTIGPSEGESDGPKGEE